MKLEMTSSPKTIKLIPLIYLEDPDGGITMSSRYQSGGEFRSQTFPPSLLGSYAICSVTVKLTVSFSNPFLGSHYCFRVLRQTNIPRKSVQSAFRAISRRLFVAESVMLNLQKLWMDTPMPEDFLARIEDIDTDYPTYGGVAFLDLISPAVKKKLPATLDVFFSKLERRANEVREALKDYWVDEAAEHVKTFIKR